MDDIKTLTIDQIMKNPKLVTEQFHLNDLEDDEKLLCRPLYLNDVDALLIFFDCLSPSTRRFATYPSYDRSCAEQFCQEINDPGKLRMTVMNSNDKIVALFEFNFIVTDFDIQRYRQYQIELDAETDVQLAPCVADDYQNKHLGSKVLNLMVDLIKKLGKKRIILWSGVLSDNERAIRFYRRNHFHMFSEKYIADDGFECYDGILQL